MSVFRLLTCSWKLFYGFVYLYVKNPFPVYACGVHENRSQTGYKYKPFLYILFILIFINANRLYLNANSKKTKELMHILC